MKGDADIQILRLVARGLVFAMLFILAVLLIDLGRPITGRVLDIVSPASASTSAAKVTLECTQAPVIGYAEQAASSASIIGIASTPAAAHSGSNGKFYCQTSETILTKGQIPPVSIDTSINAIAIVIGVITLILTVGTSWFTQRQAEFKSYSEEISRSREIGEALIAAKVDLIRGLGAKFGAAFAARDGQILASMLEMLQSSQYERRQRAYLELKPYFGPDLRGEFPDLYFYVTLCGRRVPIGQESWCDVFS